jgi:hypothetical protein
MGQKVLELDRRINHILLTYKTDEARKLNQVNQGKRLFNAYHPKDPILSAPDQISKMR